ncbi:MAG: hypothetical protein AAF192_21480, partial [Pseudomonadota bacterium]
MTGAPIPPPTARGPAALEAFRLAVERALNEVTDRADARMGRAPTPPGPPIEAPSPSPPPSPSPTPPEAPAEPSGP